MELLTLQGPPGISKRSVKVTELSPVWERAAKSAMLPVFPFDVWDKLWVRIRSVPEVSFLILSRVDEIRIYHKIIM